MNADTSTTALDRAAARVARAALARRQLVLRTAANPSALDLLGFMRSVSDLDSELNRALTEWVQLGGK